MYVLYEHFIRNSFGLKEYWVNLFRLTSAFPVRAADKLPLNICEVKTLHILLGLRFIYIMFIVYFFKLSTFFGKL